MPHSTPPDVVIAHTSDLHIDGEEAHAKYGIDGLASLVAVLAAARAAQADVVLLAGDTFDNNRVPTAVLDEVACLLAEAAIPVVILPGNHDPALPDSVFVRRGLARVANVNVLGVTDEEAVVLPRHDLEIWGHAHRDYEDMAPLRGPRSRSTRWQIAMAHGHYEPPETLATPLRPSWLFSDDAIAATEADYLALGHWDRAVRVGDGAVPAFYSGSPSLARSVNLIRLTTGGEVIVRREPLE